LSTFIAHDLYGHSNQLNSAECLSARDCAEEQLSTNLTQAKRRN
jgi:hypothetical protein